MFYSTFDSSLLNYYSIKQAPRHNSRRKSQRRKSSSKIGGGSNQTGNSWITAVAKARKQLGIKGFQAVRKGTSTL